MGQRKNPQPCLAVSSAESMSRAFMLSTHCETFRFVGLNERGSEELHPPCGSQPFQFWASQPGSPLQEGQGEVRFG